MSKFELSEVQNSHALESLSPCSSIVRCNYLQFLCLLAIDLLDFRVPWDISRKPLHSRPIECWLVY